MSANGAQPLARGHGPRQEVPRPPDRGRAHVVSLSPARGRRRRRVLLRRQGRDARPGRRVGIGQDDRRAHDPPAPRPRRGLDHLRRGRHRGLSALRAPGRPPADADGVPGSLLVAQPAHEGRQRDRGARAGPRRHRALGGRAARGGDARARRAAARARPSATRASSPAASGSGSRSRAPSRRARASSSRTSPSPRSTSPFRRRSSTCWHSFSGSST